MASPESIHILTDPVGRIACHQCGHRIDVTDKSPFSTVVCPNCNTRTPVPAQLGSFLLFKELGKGAMGAVYQAFDRTLKRHVAIKVMHRSMGQDRQFVSQFLGEARALAALNQANIVQIYACGEEKAQPYIVMELVPGGRVDHLMGKGKPLDESFVLKIGIDVAQGLKAAQQIGLTHGDIKPENILFAKDGTAKVVDFGLASFGAQQPKKGEIWGTPFYIAPEKVKGGKGDQQSDIYSLGASLFHVFTGKPPFDAETAQAVVTARLKGPAPDIRTLRNDLRPATAALIARMLEAEPARRYPTYDSLLADLRGALDAAGIRPSTAPARRPRRSARPLVIGSLFLLAALAAAFFLLPEKKPPVRSPVTSSKPVEAPPPEPAPVPSKEPPPPVKESARPAPSPRATDKPMMTFPLRREDADFILEAAADAYIQGAGKNKDESESRFGGEETLWVKAASADELHVARKTYILYDLGELDGQVVKDATLVLTTAKGGKNAAIPSYTLQLWGVPHAGSDTSWSDDAKAGGLTWNSAPANERTKSDRLADNAVLLATFAIAANPGAGTAIRFANGDSVREDEFVRFINEHAGRPLTLAVTADVKPAHRSGWKFASRESGEPPLLLLKK